MSVLMHEYEFVGGPLDGLRKCTEGQPILVMRDIVLKDWDSKTNVRIMEEPEYLLMRGRYVYGRLRNQS